MYEFRDATERITTLRKKIRDRIVWCDSERAVYITEACKQYEHYPPVLKRALMLKYLNEKRTILVQDDELIVGNKGKNIFSSPRYPEWGGTSLWVLGPVLGHQWVLKDGIYYTPEGEEPKQCITEEDFHQLLEAADYWKDHQMDLPSTSWTPDCYKELEDMGVTSYMKMGASPYGLSSGHVISGYEKIINTGYKAIKEEAQNWLDNHYEDIMGDDMEKYIFYKAVIAVCEAGEIQAHRYAEACRAKANEVESEDRKQELLKMADSIDWLAENPARNFWEACQGTILYHLLITMETVIPGPAFGRFDQYTWPFLEKDLKEGNLTEDEAQEIVDAFFLKANCFYDAGPPVVAQTTGIGNTYQHTTLGGVDKKTGEDATNPVTYMVLETMGRLKLHDPTISLRINKNSPDKLWECAFETNKLVGGLPLLQNDEVIIPAIIKELGFELEDARDYGIIGCQEIVGCGTDWARPNGTNPPHCSMLWGAMLMIALNNGVNPLNGAQGSLKTGYLYEMNSIEEVRQALKKVATFYTKMMVSYGNYVQEVSVPLAPQPAMSISIKGCMEKGKDCTNGGAKYNTFGGTATGLATIADSLTTIKYMCFDKKLCTTKELYDAVMANWEGHEELRQRIVNEVPHYGNADPYADEELDWVVNLYYEICGECSDQFSDVYKAGLYGASDHVAQGYRTWATPEGRHTGEPIADAMSPVQGFDKCGPTAVFASTVTFDHHHYMDGIALNLRIHPSALSSEDGVQKLVNMTKTYFEQGGLEVQYNIVDTETLRAAQAEPEKYRDLVVRIAGYSAYFVELTRDQQNDVIARNENRF